MWHKQVSQIAIIILDQTIDQKGKISRPIVDTDKVHRLERSLCAMERDLCAFGNGCETVTAAVLYFLKIRKRC